MRLTSIGGFVTGNGRALRMLLQTQLLHHTPVSGMGLPHGILQYVLVKHAPHGIGIHRSRICGLNDVGEHIFGLRRLRLRLLGT